MKITIYFYRPVRHHTEFTERWLNEGYLLMTQAAERKYMPGVFVYDEAVWHTGKSRHFV